MSARELDHLLWRYEYGRLPAAQLELKLREELRRLLEASEEQGDPLSVRRWSARELLAARDEALRAASLSLPSRQYHEMLRQLRKADEALAAVRGAVETGQRVDRAVAALGAIYALASKESLRRMPAISSLAGLNDTISLCMFNGRYGQASDVGALCESMAATLTLRRVPTPEEQADAAARIAALRELCLATRPFAVEEEQDPDADGSLEQLQHLLEEHYTALAGRLLAELEVALAARRRFRHHFLRTIDEAATQALRRMVRERSWDGAVDHDCQIAIAMDGGQP
jgi:hypothetical protein